MVLHAYNSSFVGIGNRTVISGQPRQNLKILFENYLNQKDLEACLKQVNRCLACAKPQVQTSVLPTLKEIKNC
jgi:hypothetical protein